MKKTVSLCLCIIMVFLCFAGCAGNDTPQTTAAQKTEDGTREALCPICNITVSWMGLTQAYVDTINITDAQGETIDSAIMSGEVYETRHYYLAEDLTYKDSPIMGFFRGPGKGLTSCLDLNGHNITTTATTSIFGNSGVLNVMGDGIVTGYSPNFHEGAAVRCGNRNANNGLNLYGGTYKKTDSTEKNNPVVAFDGAGRCVSVYDGVVIDGGNGVAVFADSSPSREKEGYLLLQGCSIKGDVKLAAYDGFATKADFVDCSVEGTVVVPEGHIVNLKGKVFIQKLSLAEGVKLFQNDLAEGSIIGIDAVGVFSQTADQAAAYMAYFTPADPSKKIRVENGALCCE